MNVVEDLYAKVRRLSDLEGRQSHGSHRYDHAPAKCQYCREWCLAVVEVAIAGERVFFPLEAVRVVLTELRGDLK